MRSHMISDDTNLGTGLMTFLVQGTGWFDPGNFTAVKQKSPGCPICSCCQSLLLITLSVTHRQGMQTILSTSLNQTWQTHMQCVVVQIVLNSMTVVHCFQKALSHHNGTEELLALKT